MQALYCSLWRAHQTTLERDVLILAYNDEAKSDVATFDAFMRLGQALANVRTTMFPEVIDIIRTATEAYFILEDPKAFALLDGLKGKRLEVSQAVHLMTAMVKGFSELERLHLVYSCVRPKMIYLTEDGLPLLPDLSLVRFEAGLGYNPPIEFSEGMVPYLAPEQYRHEMDMQDARTVMYALAMTIYALTTGQIPYGALSPRRILEAKLTQALPSPQDIVKGFPSSLTQILMRMAQRDPDDRYPNWDAVRFDLHQFSIGVDIVCPKQEGATFAPPTGTRSRMRATQVYRKSSLRRARHAAFRRKTLTVIHMLWTLVLVVLIGGLIAIIVAYSLKG